MAPKAGAYTVRYGARVASGTGKTLNLSVNGGAAQPTTIPVGGLVNVPLPGGGTGKTFPTVTGPTVTFSTPGRTA